MNITHIMKIIHLTMGFMFCQTFFSNFSQKSPVAVTGGCPRRKREIRPISPGTEAGPPVFDRIRAFAL
jgi:hypothetical protein